MKLETIKALTECANLLDPKNNYNQSVSNNRYTLLYHLLLKNKRISEKEILGQLYEDQKMYNQFRMLKIRFADNLVDIIIDNFDPQILGAKKSTVLPCKYLKEEFIVNLCFETGYRNIGIPIANRLIHKYIKVEKIDRQVSILRILIQHYGLMGFGYSQYIKLDKMFSLLIRQQHILLELERDYTSLAICVVNPEHKIENEQLNKIQDKLLSYSLSDQLDNFYQRLYYYNSVYFIHLIKKNHLLLLDICINAIEYFEQKKHISLAPLFQFHQKIGIYYMLMQDYKNARDSFKTCFEFEPLPGGVAWQFNYRYIFLSHVLSSNYNEAAGVLSTVTNHKGLKKLSENLREPWYIKEAFIHFLIKTGKIETETINHIQLRPFRLTRFMNEVHQFSKDKTGYNITINILQYLFLLADKKYDKALDKLNSLKQYNYRYLKKPEFARASNFIKMLLKIPEGRYRASLIRKKADRYQRKLLENPLDYSERALSLEIIPYEQLWEEIMSIFPE